ncbi:MAG: DUF2934 domain-containing protein [Terriglobales bacterium]
MNDPKTHQQPKAKIVVGPKSSPGEVTIMADTVPSQDRIRVRAYELYQNRGGEPGRDEQDWLCAEQEILKPKR